jgi:hypothetical protein
MPQERCLILIPFVVENFLVVLAFVRDVRRIFLAEGMKSVNQGDLYFMRSLETKLSQGAGAGSDSGRAPVTLRTQSLTAAATISSTRRRPSSPPMLPSLNGVFGIGRQLSREPSYVNGWGKPVNSGLYCESLPPNL